MHHVGRSPTGQRPVHETDTNSSAPPVSDDILARVLETLPSQPWLPGMQQVLSEALGLPKPLVKRAIKQLIANGQAFEQVDGVVFDSSGVIRALDSERAASHYVVGAIYEGRKRVT
jgi:hypothetical protein